MCIRDSVRSLGKSLNKAELAMTRKIKGTAHRTEYWIIAERSWGDEKSVDSSRSNIKVVITPAITVNSRHPFIQMGSIFLAFS